jgi:hypothetical protein
MKPSPHLSRAFAALANLYDGNRHYSPFWRWGYASRLLDRDRRQAPSVSKTGFATPAAYTDPNCRIIGTLGPPRVFRVDLVALVQTARSDRLRWHAERAEVGNG